MGLWNRETSEEIAKAINTCARFILPSLNGIGFRCIQRAYKAIIKRLMQQYTAFVASGYHPKIFGETTVIIIPKPEKPD